MLLVALSALSCSTSVRPAFTLPVATSTVPAHAAPIDPVTVVVLGQSNASGAVGPSPYVLADQIAAGGRVIDNGEELTEYPFLVGPEPWIVDELLARGMYPTVVIRASNGINLENLRVTQMPLLLADFDTGPAASLTPDLVLIWQGEADTKVESSARTYRDRLVGPFGTTGAESLRDQLLARWPGVPILLVELRVRDYDYAPFHPVVRAAQHAAGTLPGMCLVPSYDAPLLGGEDADNQPHVSVEGLEIVGRRAVAAGLALMAGDRCP